MRKAIIKNYLDVLLIQVVTAIFICEFCLESSKTDNIFYQYGGTWKSVKKY